METGQFNYYLVAYLGTEHTVTVLARLGSRRSRCVPSARPRAQFIRVSPDFHRGRQLTLSDDISTRSEALIPA